MQRKRNSSAFSMGAARGGLEEGEEEGEVTDERPQKRPNLSKVSPNAVSKKSQQAGGSSAPNRQDSRDGRTQSYGHGQSSQRHQQQYNNDRHKRDDDRGGNTGNRGGGGSDQAISPRHDPRDVRAQGKGSHSGGPPYQHNDKMDIRRQDKYTKKDTRITVSNSSQSRQHVESLSTCNDNKAILFRQDSAFKQREEPKPPTIIGLHDVWTQVQLKAQLVDYDLSMSLLELGEVNNTVPASIPFEPIGDHSNTSSGHPPSAGEQRSQHAQPALHRNNSSVSNHNGGNSDSYNRSNKNLSLKNHNRGSSAGGGRTSWSQQHRR